MPVDHISSHKLLLLILIRWFIRFNIATDEYKDITYCYKGFILYTKLKSDSEKK